MSFPWEVENIPSNLATLTRLRQGDRLSVLKEGENTDGNRYGEGNRGLRALFKIEGQMRQGFVRHKKGESILNDGQYLNTLVRFFRESVVAWVRRVVTGAQVTGAVLGLERLRLTYQKDQVRLAKVNEILAAIQRELRGLYVEGVVVNPDNRSALIGLQTIPGMRERIMNIICAPTQNCTTESNTGATEEFLTAIYGANAQPQPPTIVPVGNFEYRRHSLGVCTQFQLDSLDRDGLYIDGVSLKNNRGAFVKLFNCANRDEGMLFAISQVSSQASLTGVPNLLLMEGGRDGQRKVGLIQVGGQRLTISIGGGHATLKKRGKPVVITTEQILPGTHQAEDQNSNEFPKPLSQFGITNIRLRFSVVLARAGNRITCDLIESKLDVTTG